MKLTKILLLTILMISMYSASYAQAEKYPVYLEYYWSGRSQEFAIKVTNKLITVTEKGEQYVNEYNEAAALYKKTNDEYEHALSNIENPKNSYDYQRCKRLKGEVESLEKQYNSAQIGLALVKANYDLCTSNCEMIYNNYKNIANRINNISRSHNAKQQELQSLSNSISRKISNYNNQLNELKNKYDLNYLRNSLNYKGEKLANYIEEQKI